MNNKPLDRPYDKSRRQVQADLTRVLVLQAARDLLAGPAGTSGFTLDAVASHAGVSRATVFNLFGGRPGLLTALFDEMSGRAGLMDVDALLAQEDSWTALCEYVQRFGDFYEAERGPLKKLRAYAAFDADFSRLVRSRDDKRSAGLLYLVQCLPTTSKLPAAHQRKLVSKLKALLLLEVFESIAGPQQPLQRATPVVLEMARALVETVPATSPPPSSRAKSAHRR